MLSDVGVVEDVSEDVLSSAGGGDAGVGEPEAVGITAVHGKHFVGRTAGMVPAGVGVERDIEADIAGEFLEGCEVGGLIAGFVVELDADDGTAVFEEEAVELFGERGVPLASVSER